MDFSLRWALTLLGLCLLVRASQLNGKEGVLEGKISILSEYISLSDQNSDDEDYQTSGNGKRPKPDEKPLVPRRAPDNSSFLCPTTGKGNEAIYEIDLASEDEQEQIDPTHKSYGTCQDGKRQLSQEECCQCWPF